MTYAYATVADAEGLCGADRIASICDRDDDGLVDTASFTRQLAVATQQMNGYLLGRYPIPLEANGYVVPDIFAKYCVDIAIYNSALDASVRSTEMRLRYEDALKYMDMIATNKIKIPLAKTVEPEVPVTQINVSATASTVPGRSIIATYPDRTWTPANTRRIL